MGGPVPCERGPVMHSFFAEGPLESGRLITLGAEESAHLCRVLRLRPGAAVRVLNGSELWDGELTEANERASVVRALSPCPSPESGTKVTLLQGTPKGDKLETIAQKGTELGMWELWPVDMARSVARGNDRRRDRLCRVALEAAKQSGRAHVPFVAPVRGLAGALQEISAFDLALVAWEGEETLSLSRAVREYVNEHGSPASVLIVIGPEGGIAPQEWQALREAGAVSVSLGRRILRTETAGLCALSVLWAALGEM